MKAGIVTPDGSFVLADRAAPVATPGCALIDVWAAGIGPPDLMRAKGFLAR